MTKPIISDAAVEAAAKAVYGGDHLDGSPQRDAWLRDFRIALEAAAPHMIAATPAPSSELNDHSELADLIWSHTDGTDEDVPEIAARRIYDAGWRKVAPRITFADKMAKRSLDALEHESWRNKQ